MGRTKLSWSVAVWVLGLGGCFSDPASSPESGAEAPLGSTGEVLTTTGDASTGALEGSSESSGEPSTSSETDTMASAEIRAVHASPSVGPVDVYVAGEAEPLFEDLDYGETSDRIEVPDGLIAFQFRPPTLLVIPRRSTPAPSCCSKTATPSRRSLRAFSIRTTTTLAFGSCLSPKTGARSFKVGREPESSTWGRTRRASVSMETSRCPGRSIASRRATLRASS